MKLNSLERVQVKLNNCRDIIQNQSGVDGLFNLTNELRSVLDWGRELQTELNYSSNKISDENTKKKLSILITGIKLLDSTNLFDLNHRIMELTQRINKIETEV